MQMMIKMPNGVRSSIHVLYCTLDTIFTCTITLTILMTCDKKGEIFTFPELRYTLADIIFLSSYMPSFASIIIFFKSKFGDYLQNRTYFVTH